MQRLSSNTQGTYTVSVIIIIIVVVVGTTTHRQSWPLSKVPPPFLLHGCCPPATFSQHPQILPTSSLHLQRGLLTFITVLQAAGTSVSQANRPLPFLLHDQPTAAWQL